MVLAEKGGNKLHLLVIWYVEAYSVMVVFTSDKYGNNETDTKCLPSNKKCPGYTGDRIPNEQNYKEEATLEEKKFEKETDADISKLFILAAWPFTFI